MTNRKFGDRLTSLLMLLCMSVVVAGCTVPLTCKLYNNTGMSLEVVQRDKHGQEKSLSFARKEWVTLRDWGYFTYQVEHERVVWNYDPPIATYIPSSDYIEASGFGPFFKRTVRAQLNKDGKIYLLKIGQDAQSSAISEQPDGYPLVPSATTTTGS